MINSPDHTETNTDRIIRESRACAAGRERIASVDEFIPGVDYTNEYLEERLSKMPDAVPHGQEFTLETIPAGNFETLRFCEGHFESLRDLFWLEVTEDRATVIVGRLRELGEHRATIKAVLEARYAAGELGPNARRVMAIRTAAAVSVMLTCLLGSYGCWQPIDAVIAKKVRQEQHIATRNPDGDVRPGLTAYQAGLLDEVRQWGFEGGRFVGLRS